MYASINDSEIIRRVLIYFAQTFVSLEIEAAAKPVLLTTPRAFGFSRNAGLVRCIGGKEIGWCIRATQIRSFRSTKNFEVRVSIRCG